MNPALLQGAHTFALESRASYFVEIEDERGIASLEVLAKDKGLQIRFLGEGSNVVLPPNLSMILARFAPVESIRVVQREGVKAHLRIGAGYPWRRLVKNTLSLGYFGLEALAGIPGQFGAAVVQNIGAYGSELGDFVVSVRVYDFVSHAFFEMSAQACEFAYRNSVFKKHKNRYVVVSAVLSLSSEPGIFKNTRLPKALRVHTHPEEVFQTVLKLRAEKLPNPKDFPNAGSFFKNPLLSNDHAKMLQKKDPNIVLYPFDEHHKKASAAYLIEQSGFKKGHQFGSVMLSKKHALVLGHEGSGTYEDVCKARNAIQKSVRSAFGITLEEEVEIFHGADASLA